MYLKLLFGPDGVFYRSLSLMDDIVRIWELKYEYGGKK